MWGLEGRSFFHDGSWSHSYSATLEDLGQPEALGQPLLSQHFLKQVPAWDLGAWEKMPVPVCLLPTEQSRREHAEECLLPLASVEPFPAEPPGSWQPGGDGREREARARPGGGQHVSLKPCVLCFRRLAGLF